MYIITLRSPSLALYLGNGGWKCREVEASVFDSIEDAVDTFKDFHDSIPSLAREFFKIEEV